MSNAPAIAQQPVSRTVAPSASATFTVQATGSDLRYQWRKNDSPIPGATNSTFTISSVSPADAGAYVVIVSNAGGQVASSPASLTVQVAPTLASPPADRTVTAGATVLLAADARGTEPLTYQWLRDGTAIPGATHSSLTFAPARSSDSGTYSVVVTNIAGTITSPAAALTVNPVSRISNLSIRSRVGGNAGVLTVGLTIGGADTAGDKPILLRAVGPTLAAFGVDGVLADPRLTILSGQTAIAQNDDWSGNPQISSSGTAVGAFNLADAASRDAALLHAAPIGGYTVQITGEGTTNGVTLAEVYDTTSTNNFLATTPRLTNLSALTQVGTGGDILIAGFSISGVTPRTVLIRGIGPTLAAFGVAEPLSDPRLEIFATGVTTAHSSNDNWASATNATQVATAATSVGAFGLANDSRDAALLVTLPPGSYTAQISGVNNTTGTTLVELYELP